MKNLILNGRGPFLPAVLRPKNSLLAFVLILLCCTSASAQDGGSTPRLDPVFRSLLAARQAGKDSLLRRTLSARYHVDPVQAKDARSPTPVERYSCIVYTTNAQALRDSGIIVNSVLPTFVTAQATLDQIALMGSIPGVTYIKAPKTLGLNNDVAVGNSGASLLHAGRLNNTVYKGKKVLVAIFDTGIDWDHPDFRDPADQTRSRILRIWDQTLTPVAGEASPTGFNYGVEYTQAQISDELDGSPANFVRERDTDGHGTHVAGTAAGNGAALPTRKYTGLAPEADLLIIKGGNGTFTSDRVIDALTYVQALAASLGRPVVINFSLGSLLTSHDGKDDEEIAVDNFTASGSGRIAVVAAGNYNGYNQHNRFTLGGASSVVTNINVKAVSSSTTTIINYLMYLSGSNPAAATIAVPGGPTFTVNASHDTTLSILGGNFNLSSFNYVDPNNNNRFIYLTVARNGTNTASPVGNWSLSLTNNTGTAVTADGWIQKSDNTLDTVLLTGGDNDFLIGTPGNATSAITVASYVGKLSTFTSTGSTQFYRVERQDSISSFSARGPRRDGVMKPDISAVGQGVVSCLSSDATVPGIITNTGLYHMLQGTSMSSPVVAGSVALLLQQDPSVSAIQVKSNLLATANKDALTELTGATPNPTWGYGRLDVFKAASSACATVNRKTYQYDNPGRSSQYNTFYPISTQRVAVRFTPDISGKLGGFYLFTYPFTTALFVEVRTNNGGVPGTLLGTMNLDSASILKFTMNYFDLSRMNVSVTSASDYFLILGRSAAGSTNWGLFCENLVLDNRSITSSDGGASWNPYAYDFSIRSVVYSSSQLTGAIAAVTSSDNRDVNTSNNFINSSCGLISTVTPNGANPVTGTIASNVWIETGVPLYANDPYVSRHYQITPSANAATVTGRVTLYFTQAEFTSFNNDPHSALDLPANPGDATGKANLRIGKYSGTSSDGSGQPASYTGAITLIDPDDTDIVWNADASRWEVSFTTTGFSGFVVQTKTTTLPLIIEYFNGRTDRTGNLLNWKLSCSNSSAVFNVERSRNGYDFERIGQLATSLASCSLPVSFTDAAPMAGDNYYRIRITESTGSVRYTGVVLLRESGKVTTLFPTVLTGTTTVQVSYAGTRGSLTITDGTGKQLYVHTLTAGVQSLALPLRTSGLYFYTIKNDEGRTTGGKLLVR